MVTLLVVFVLVVTVVFAVVVPVCLPRLSPGIYIAICWIPVAALGLEWVFADRLMRALSYAVVLVPFTTCIVSLLLGTVGATLVIRQPQGERRGLLGATLLASLPGLLLLGYVAYAFVAAR